ncbi:MAG: protein-disulfide isomerase [Gammaproteobacteria bacterium]|jgi:thiol:disulfide interchange protein DsbC|nr:protein-disulfide isomerase [Gammaproteobacteria bacterium]|tara:strand:+ start:5006 stop:5740 length:735 start_codon:yes stop_codon:yes gene_type:complete
MKIVSTVLIVLSLALSSAALAEGELSPEQVKEKLQQVRPDLPIREVTKSSLPGFYEVKLVENTLLFVNSDASFFIAGDLYRIETEQFVNVSEEQRSLDRRKILSEVNQSEMVVFSPPEGKKKTSVVVFTDIDCGYCRKLHKEVPELNRLGVEIRYLAYPRAGVKSKSFDKYVSAWCSDNQQLAMTRAKLGQEVEEKDCDNPVAEQYALGNQVGVTGTPALIFEDGTLLPGYLPAEELVNRLGIN